MSKKTKNELRVEWASSAIANFRTSTGADECDAVKDLLADLMHWCAANNQDFSKELKSATMHYEAEVKDPNA